MGKKIITIFYFISVDIDNYHDKCRSLFLSSLKPDFCSKVKVVETRGFIYNRCVRTKPALKEAYATSYAKGGIYKNKLDGKILHLHANSDPCVQTFSRSEKINEVNNFKLCFHVDIHIYIKYSTLIMEISTEITESHYAEVKQKLGYMNLDICSGCAWSLFLWHAMF